MVYYIKLRYKLMPYIYSLAGKTYLEDGTMMRALAMDFPQDSKVFGINDQYLFGPSLLVNPVTVKGLTSRKVYLPSGTVWYDFYSGKAENGGKEIDAAAPYERVPLFVKAGTILPLGPEVQHTSEKKATEITLMVYAGADGDFTLYEDEGTNNNYEKGRHSTIAFNYNNQTRELTIGKQNGSFDGMLKDREFKVVLVSENNAVGYDSQKIKSKSIKYKGNEIKVKLN